MKVINKALGEIIAEKRRNRGLSQETLAFECEKHRTYISQLERGLKSPTVGVLYDISVALNVPLSQIFGLLETRIKREKNET